MKLKHFELHTAQAVRQEHLSFVNQLFSSPNTSEDNFVLTWDRLEDSKAVQVNFVVTILLLVHTEALLFKCRLSEAAVQHALNWEANFGLDKQRHKGLGPLYRPNKAMDLM